MSGLPIPRSMMSSPSRRACIFRSLTIEKTYGGKRSMRRNSMPQLTAPQPSVCSVVRNPQHSADRMVERMVERSVVRVVQVGCVAVEAMEVRELEPAVDDRRVERRSPPVAQAAQSSRAKVVVAEHFGAEPPDG